MSYQEKLTQVLPQLQAQMLARKAQLIEELRAQRAGAAVSHEHPEPGDGEAVMDLENDLEIAEYERDQNELNLIIAALARIQAGDYGYCTDCGADIGIARLEATPYAPRCIHCQEKIERQ